MITNISTYALFRSDAELQSALRIQLDDLNNCKRMITKDPAADFKVIKKGALLSACDRCSKWARKLEDQGSLSQAENLRRFFETEIDKLDRMR